ncbi:MAG: hypothetical protein ABI878_07180 [Acidobacteriota bacterium]
MALRDRIRNGLYGNEDRDVEGQEKAARFSAMLETSDRPYAAQRALFFYGIAEAVLVSAIVVAPQLVWKIELLAQETILLAVGVPFVLGFKIAHSLIAISRKNTFRTEPPIEGGVMSSFANGDKDDRRVKVWFVSAAVGIMNVFALGYLQHVRMS